MVPVLASHRALAVPEILHYIFLEFGPSEDPGLHFTAVTLSGSSAACQWDGEVYFNPGNRDALAKLARCCKAFADIALEILWKVQTSIVPLLSLVTSFKKRDGSYVRIKLTISGPIANQSIHVHQTFVSKIAGSWKRVELYARRIRCLVVSADAGARKIDDFVFVQLAQLLKEKPLLPLLHTLTYPISAEIFLFVTDHLRRVTINGRSGQRGEAAFLHALLEKAPGVQHIASWTTFLPSSLAILAKFNHLTHLNTGDQAITGLPYLKAVAGFRHLLELHICLPRFPKLTPADRILMPALQTLVISGDDQSIQDTLQCLCNAPLVSLAITYHWSKLPKGSSWDDLWQHRLKPISKWVASLQSLELVDQERDSGDDEALVHSSNFDPLLGIAQLKYFKFTSEATFEFTDSYFLKIAESWPKLQTLLINFRKYEHEPRATYKSLEAFANLCPDLRHLSLRIYLNSGNLHTSPRMILKHGLQRLYITTPMSDSNYFLIARHLVALFPYLQEVDGAEREEEEDEDEEEPPASGFLGDWDAVAAAVRLCQVTIEDHRMRSRAPVIAHSACEVF
ncbi:hypothetical protein D9615_003812 [Tricholomella constricta]|uniref:Uncharacterized protein n=1 Tax=Tricholomella constricta TaxID=117010 RepID=A0A8H5HIF2_9AGAR|nr:hypothetical protein D9615_003812 [Tricholomella constricta]